MIEIREGCGFALWRGDLSILSPGAANDLHRTMDQMGPAS